MTKTAFFCIYTVLPGQPIYMYIYTLTDSRQPLNIWWWDSLQYIIKIIKAQAMWVKDFSNFRMCFWVWLTQNNWSSNLSGVISCTEVIRSIIIIMMGKNKQSGFNQAKFPDRPQNGNKEWKTRRTLRRTVTKE